MRILDAIVFTTKPKLGLAMPERARAPGVPVSWVTGDTVHGADSAIRRWGRCGSGAATC